MKLARLQIVLLAAAFLPCLTASGGCGLQGEGQRCSILNNNADNTSNDCESGLECVSKNTLNTNSDICCPANGGKATEKACIPGALSGNAAGVGSTTSASTSATTTGSGGGGGAGGGS